MATFYTGVPSNVAFPGLLSIASSTNSNPLAITISGSHNLVTGDVVDISSHVGNVTANGVWPITVTGPSSFTIPTFGVAVGGGSGFVQPLSMGAYAVPSDGDPDNAASIFPSISNAGDRSAFLALQTGPYKLSQRVIGGAAHGGATGTSWCQTNSSINGYQNFQQSAVDIHWGIGSVQAGDIIEAELSATVEIQSISVGTFNPVVSLAYGLGDWGVGPLVFNQCAAKTLSTPGGGNWFVPVNLKAFIGDAVVGTAFTTVGSGTNGLLEFKFMGNVLGVSSTLFGVGDYTFDMKVWRPTGVPQ